MTIYLGRMLPYGSSDYEGRDGQPLNAPISILLRVGFTGTRHVTIPPVGSYPTFPSLLRLRGAVYFCCTFLKVAFTGRYPAPLSCGARTFLTECFIRAVTWLTQFKPFLYSISRSSCRSFRTRSSDCLPGTSSRRSSKRSFRSRNSGCR